MLRMLGATPGKVGALLLCEALWLAVLASVLGLAAGHGLAAVVGAMLHVPGGLGVIEAVFLASLGGRLPEGQLVAALLAYRAAFYLLPLLTATVMHLTLEALARRRERQG